MLQQNEEILLRDPNFNQVIHPMLTTAHAVVEQALDTAWQVHRTQVWAKLNPKERAVRHQKV